jgi:hypothetical protein
MITTDRITVGHLKRKAYLYVRQSTLYQTEQNPESLDRQYDFRRQALSLGWHDDQIVTLDEDLGQSGAEATHRPDFQRLVADVGLGQVGVVLSLRPPDLSGFPFRGRLTGSRCGRGCFVTGMRGGREVAAGNKSGTFDLGKSCILSGVRTKVPCRNHYCR